MISVSDYIFSFLRARYDGQHVFMLSGGGCMYLCNSLGKSKLDYTCCLHEQAAAIAALAYAQYTNDIGVALVTSGPGATNAITGAAAAWTESVPLLVLSGQVKTEDSAKISGVRVKGVQEAPIIDMVKPITKYAAVIDNPSEIKYHLEKAVFLAKEGRPGPVWLDIPLDIQSAQVDESTLKSFPEPVNNKVDLKDKAEEIVRLINSAERPVILAGYGIRISNSTADFLKLIEKLNIPILTTWKAIDIIPDDHPLFFGRPGIAGQRAANFVQQNADLLIALGARLDFPQTGFNQSLFAREAKKVIVDIDPSELKKFNSLKVDYPICADAGDLIRELIKAGAPAIGKTDWLNQCKQWRDAYTTVLPEHRQKKDYASLYVLVEAISNALTKDDLIVPGSSGMGSDVSYQVTRIKEGQRMLNSPGLGSMGFGVPSALGACIASNGKRTVCVNGDGGFQMNIQELETIKSHNLPIKFFVLNNQGYGSIRNTQRNYFGGFYVGSSRESGVSLPDVKALGAAYGYKVFSISNNAEIDSVVRNVLNAEGPVLCEVLIDPNDTLCFRASSRILPDGSAVSTPVEDLYPFLPRKEFYKNMYIKPINATGINISTILFDLDGTIINSKSGIISSMKYALRENGMAAADDAAIAKTIGVPLKDMILKLQPDIDSGKVAEIIASYRKHHGEKGIYDYTLFDGMDKVLQELSNEFDLYIATFKLQSMAKKAMAHLNIDRYFLDIKGIDSDQSKKTKAMLIKELIEERGLDCGRTVMVGDRREDVAAAGANNVKTVGVSYGYGTAEELSGAVTVVDSAVDLIKVLI
ncbi:acetolactate synthase-like protein [Fibrobacteres bacterium R8-0-B4]